MSILTRYAVPGALMAIILKMVYFLAFSPDETMDMYVRFAYLMLFLIALFLGLRAFKRENPGTDFPSDIKLGMKVASVFALILSGFTWLYYQWINPEYFEDRIDVVAKAAEAAGQEAEKALGTAEFIFSPFTHSTITLFGFMVIGFFYTIILVMIMRGKPEAFR